MRIKFMKIYFPTLLLLFISFSIKAQENKVIEALSTQEANNLKTSDIEAYRYLVYQSEHAAYLLELPEEKTADYPTISTIKLKNTNKAINVKNITPENFNPLLYDFTEIKSLGNVKLEGTNYVISRIADNVLETRYKNYQKNYLNIE